MKVFSSNLNNSSTPKFYARANYSFNAGIRLSLITAIALGLAACGGTGQDSGSTHNVQQTHRGLVIDGYLARSTVFIDSNNNGTRDPWEPFAFTDNEGYYSYNPNTETDYCASTASAQEQQYCLIGNTERSDAVIRIDGGYDVLTGEPFTGQLSRRLSLSDSTTTSNAVITPLTSIITNVTDSTQRESLLQSIGVEESELDVNYLNTNGSGAVDSNLLNTALKIHKTVAILSDRLTDTYTIIGDEIGTPNDASNAVYTQLATQLSSSDVTLDAALGSSSTLAAVLDSAEADLRAVYERKDETPPSDIGSTQDTSGFSRVLQISTSIPNVVNELIDPNAGDITSNDATGATRALESVVIKAVAETSTDTSIDNAINFFTNDSNDTLIDALTSALENDTADVASLSQNDFTGSDFDSAEEISSAAVLGENVTPFTQVGGLQLKVSDLDLGQGPNRLQDKEVEFYFNGETTDIQGSFSACVKFIEDASTDGTLGDGSTRGELVDGFWSMLDAEANSVESYSLLLTITFLGTTYQAILKPAGMQTIEQTEYHKIRFDNDGEFRSWYSTDGFIESSSVPSTNSECEERLPSRVGL